jgi:hypothetical protein
VFKSQFIIKQAYVDSHLFYTITVDAKNVGNRVAAGYESLVMKVLEIALDLCRPFPCNIKKLTVIEFACCNEVLVYHG